MGVGMMGVVVLLAFFSLRLAVCVLCDCVMNIDSF